MPTSKTWYRKIKEPPFKYEVILPVSCRLPIQANLPDCRGSWKDSKVEVLRIKDRDMTILPGYKWDGATCAPDFEAVMLPALVHDILYDAIKSGYNIPFELADAVFMALMKRTRFGLKNTYYSAVARLGGTVRSKDNGMLLIK